MSFSLKKRCPRCNTKVANEMAICPTCQLNFGKFERATNEEAKRALNDGDKSRVLLRTGLPNDVKKSTLLLLAIFLGFMGAHNYYVGRTKRGIFFSLFFVVGILNVIFNLVLKIKLGGLVDQIFTLLVLVWGVVVYMWIVDVAKICFNKFKIPVSLPR